MKSIGCANFLAYHRHRQQRRLRWARGGEKVQLPLLRERLHEKHQVPVPINWSQTETAANPRLPPFPLRIPPAAKNNHRDGARTLRTWDSKSRIPNMAR